MLWRKKWGQNDLLLFCHLKAFKYLILKGGKKKYFFIIPQRIKFTFTFCFFVFLYQVDLFVSHITDMQTEIIDFSLRFSFHFISFRFISFIFVRQTIINHLHIIFFYFFILFFFLVFFISFAPFEYYFPCLHICNSISTWSHPCMVLMHSI